MPEKNQMAFAGQPDRPHTFPAFEEFGGREFMDAPDLELVASNLIGSSRLRFHDDGPPVIRYLWRKEGGASRGASNLAKTQKVSGPTRFFAGDADFVIWFAWDNLRFLNMGETEELTRATRWQIEALMFHELKQIVAKEDKDGALISYGLQAPEVFAFIEELEYYGPWHHTQVRMATALQPWLLDLGEDA